MKIKNKYKKIITLSLAMLLGIGVLSASARTDTISSQFLALGNSESEGVVLEESESDEPILGESKTDENILPLPQSDILFQFREKGTVQENNLGVDLYLTGNVSSVKMKTSGKKEQIQTLHDDENTAVSPTHQIRENRMFSHVEETEPVTIIPNATLGYSVTITEVAQDKVLESDTHANFVLQEEGEYAFGLYDAENLWIADLLYDTRSGTPGEITIKVADGFQITKNNLLVTIDYVVPASDRPQKLLVTMPPFYAINALPAAQAGITYSNSFHDFNQAPYETVPFGDKLIEYSQTVSPFVFRQSVLEISMEERVFGQISFTLTLSPVTAHSLNVSNVMAYFGENPDKIPLLIMADAKNPDGDIFNTVVFQGDSTLTDTSGTPVENKITFPEKDTPKTPEPYYRTLTPFAKVPLALYPKVSVPHYPYSNVSRLTPYIDNAPVGTTETLVDVDGKKYVSSPRMESGFRNFNHGFIIATTTVLLPFPTINQLQPDIQIPAGPIYIEYTYKGERFREIEYLLNDLPTGQAYKPIPVIAYKSAQGYWSTVVSDSYHVQGKKNQQFQITVPNSAPGSYLSNPNQPLLPMVYKDVIITFDIPFELTLKEMDYITSAPYPNHPLFGKMKPSKAEYTTFEGGSGTIPVPDDVDKLVFPNEIGHVKSLRLFYDLWVYNIDNTFYPTVDIGTKTEAGTPIPENKIVYINTNFTTVSETMIECYDTVDEKAVPFSGSGRPLQVRLSIEEDGIRFGTYSDHSYLANYKGYAYTSLRTYKETATTFNSGDEISFSDGKSPWKIGFKSTVNRSKDYENVKIIIDPKSESEARALSKMSGMQTSLAVGTYVSQYKIFIKTNVTPEGKMITEGVGSIRDVSFNLLPDEYVTYLEVQLGTFYGSSLPNDGTYGDLGEKIYPAKTFLAPNFRNDRYYFAGTAKQELIRADEPQNLVARVETSSESKYMDPTSPDYFNSTSTATLFFTPYVDVKLGTAKEVENSWRQGNTFYRGTPFRFSLSPKPNYFLNGATTVTTVYGEMVFPSYDHRIYLEVNKGFDIANVEGYTFVSMKKLPSTNLYVFEGSGQITGGEIHFTGYVRPDAQVGSNIIIFENFGIDYQHFKEKHLEPESGDTAYYLSEPYHKIEFLPNPFPTHWDVGEATDTQIYASISRNNTVNINRADIDKVYLNALVNDVNQVANASFRDYQKSTLSAQGWLTNILDSILPSYQATFYLPRTGKQIQGSQMNGVDTFFNNEFNLYLSKGIEYPSDLENLVVQYFAGDGRIVTPNSPAEWREVERIQVTFNNFAPNASALITLPLVTDYNKLGKETKILKSHIGASSSKINVAGESFTNELYTEPVAYDFLSYTLSTRVGLDRKETGQFDQVMNYVGTTNVYYEENGTEKLLYSSTTGNNTILMNQDATRIEVLPLNATYKLTKEKAVGLNENNNSDYPRDTGSLPLVLDDMINSTLYRYDAAFIALPTLRAVDITLREEESVVSSPIITTLSSFSPIDQYTKVFSVANPLIATIEQDGTITGIKRGETTYTYTVTNLLGDEFVITKKITVLKKVVPTAVFQKTLPDGPINAGDKFAFAVWSKADKSDLTAFELSVTSNSTTFTRHFLPGVKYYVEETAHGSGYTPKELIISYTTSTGNVTETTTLAGAVASFTVHADAEGMDMRFVNDSKRYSLAIEKVLLPLGGNHDFTQTFPVTVRDNVTNEIVFDSSLKGDGTGLVLSELIQNRSYTITEVKAGYDLKGIEVVNSAGSSLGITQPVDASNNSFVLTIDATHEDATILVKNQPQDMGLIKIETVPSLDFGELVNGTRVKRLRSEDVSLAIRDSRVVGGTWNLSVEASEMTTTLANGTEHTLPYNGLQFSDGIAPSVPLIPGRPTLIMNGTTQSGVPLHEEKWLSSQETGITFQSEHTLTYVGKYDLTLTWSLSSTP